MWWKKKVTMWGGKKEKILVDDFQAAADFNGVVPLLTEKQEFSYYSIPKLFPPISLKNKKKMCMCLACAQLFSSSPHSISIGGVKIVRSGNEILSSSLNEGSKACCPGYRLSGEASKMATVVCSQVARQVSCKTRGRLGRLHARVTTRGVCFAILSCFAETEC